jgi:four helix bundle protein
MNAAELKDRTKRFGIDVTRFVEYQRPTAFVLNAKNQSIRSATSVGANYHEACRARSKKEFISKIEIVLQELEETRYWLEMLDNYGCKNEEVLRRLTNEATQLIAIMTASARTAKRYYNQT